MLVVYLLILCLHYSLPCGSARIVSAVLAFGDSIVDPGNNNDIRFTLVKSNFPPYGIDFPNHVSTGRFSNGRIVGDIIASKLGVKEYLPSYINNDLELEELLTGVSFASGGTGFDPLTPITQGVFSMDDQIGFFKDYVAKLYTIAEENRVDDVIAKSLFLVCVGNNDIANTYYGTSLRLLTYDIDSYVDFMIDNAIQFVEKLVSNGAKRIGFVGLPPIGCLPSQRTLAGGLFRDCDSKQNHAAKLFNSKMPQALEKIKNNHQDLSALFLGIYDKMMDIIENPDKYGFEETRKGCCNSGLIEVSYVLCDRQLTTTQLCHDTSKYMFWDSYHPTEKGYHAVMDEMLEEHLYDFH